MKERPILFSGEMVRAILDGRKTQTRRKMKPRPPSGAPDRVTCLPLDGDIEYFLFRAQDGTVCHGLTGNVKIKGKNTCHWKCPYGFIGDRLWVRETFRVCGGTEKYPDYRATTCVPSPNDNWIPSIHMSRKYSRITLEIVNVRVERLHDISEEDAKAEGASKLVRIDQNLVRGSAMDVQGSHHNGFEYLWSSINRPGSWEKNPWVWVVEFKRIV